MVATQIRIFILFQYVGKIVYLALIIIDFLNFYAVFCDADRESSFVGEESLSRFV
jgi:hypothetical protein